MTTLKDAQKQIQQLSGSNFVLVKRDGEYIVKRKGGPIDAPDTYFTNDIDDAVATASAMSLVATHPVIATVEYWWDPLSRQWIIQLKDIEGNQVGPAEFRPNKAQLPALLDNLRDVYPNAKQVRT